MKILVIGGSYFLGRWFLQMAHQKHEITVINRGNVPIGLPGVVELQADRHDSARMQELLSQNESGFDCIVDFCAYEPGDIRSILQLPAIANRQGQSAESSASFQPGTNKKPTYFFLSTVDVLARGTGQILNENSPLEKRQFAGQEGAYIAGKVALEQELAQEAKALEIPYCCIRPPILYGPANYAPRERLFFDWIKQAGQIILPQEGSGGCFYLLYVADAAKAILKLVEMTGGDTKLSQPDVSAPVADCRITCRIPTAINLCPQPAQTYDSFAAALASVLPPFEEIRLPVETILEKQIPLPFPLTAAESERYESLYFDSLGLNITPIHEGLAREASIYLEE